MGKLRGKWYKLTNGYDSYDFFEAESYLIFRLAVLLEQRFHFAPPQTLPIPFFEGAYIDYEQLSLGWDIWSGLFLMATSEEGNQVLHRIAVEVEDMVNELVDVQVSY